MATDRQLADPMTEATVHKIIHFATLQSLKEKVGQTLASSGWFTVDQQRIDLFARATGDHQWIHVDPVRAAAGPFGTTVAHGFLTLSMLPELAESAMAIDDVRMGVNYGLNKVRFTSPLPSGSRVRGHFKLMRYEPIEGGAQLTMQATVEREGGAKPVCVAETVSRRYV
jgi:acyl dehydratase